MILARLVGERSKASGSRDVHIWRWDVPRGNGPHRRLRRREILPALMQYFSIPWDLPIRKAKEAMFRSRFIGAEEACQLGFVNHVVPRERLEEETMALAREIVENDPFTLRMLKWAANSAQDAMSFTNSIRNAHSHYMVQGLDSFTKDKLEGRGFSKVMPGVTRAMKDRGK